MWDSRYSLILTEQVRIDLPYRSNNLLSRVQSKYKLTSIDLCEMDNECPITEPWYTVICIQSKPSYSITVSNLNQAHAKNIAKFIQSTSTKSYTKYDTISAYDMRLECVITRKTTSTYLLPVGRYIDRDSCRNKPQNIHKNICV